LVDAWAKKSYEPNFIKSQMEIGRLNSAELNASNIKEELDRRKVKGLRRINLYLNVGGK
jgi:hypothetical protein